MTERHVELKDLERLAARSNVHPPGAFTDLSEVEDHLRSCSDCSRLSEAFVKLRRTAPTHDKYSGVVHPSEEDWFAYAAGIAEHLDRIAMLTHVRECSRCATVLQAALEDMQDSYNDVELEELESSSLSVQHSLAARMAQAAGAHQPLRPFKLKHWWSIGAWKPVPIAAAAALIMSVLSGGAWLYFHQADDALLARACDERRLTELHLPGSAPGPVNSPSLGGGYSEDVLPLLKLRQRARQHLDKSPNDPYWLQVEGRIALTEGDGAKAEQQLMLAKTQDPSLKGIDFDLAEAHFERGDAEQDQKEYSSALEFFSAVVNDRSYASVRAAAYYNRALCLERMNQIPSAIEDYRSSLALEKDTAWRDQIQKRLADARGKLNGSGKGSIDLETSPLGFLHVFQTDPQRADENYEVYLDHASREWLLSSDADSKSALKELATIGIMHHDAWLADLLDASQDSLSHSGLVHLAAGIKFNLRGDPDRALEDLKRADDLFSRSHNTPGQLRARSEIIYSFQRGGHSDLCLDFARAHPSPPQLRRYLWLLAYEQLQVSTCRAARGDSAEYLRDIKHCIALSKNGRFPNQVLRERGFLAETLDGAGQTDAALTAIVDGLRDCAGSPACTPMRAYQFEQSLIGLFEERKLKWAAVVAAQAAAHLSDLVANLQIRAYAQEVLGQTETIVGHTESAEAAFGRASALLASMSETQSAALYRADWETDRATLLARKGLLMAGLSKMQEAESLIARTDNFDARQRFYTRYATLLLQANRPADAERVALVAVADAEHALASATTQTERLAWEKTYGLGYRVLVASLAEEGRGREALQAWEWYRSAPYRPPSRAGDTANSYTSVQLSIGPQASLPAVVLVVADVGNGLIAWSLESSGEHGVHMIRLGSSPERISDFAQTFTELCSDRNASEENIAAIGSELYRDVFAPFQTQIDAVSSIALDIDPTFEHIPFVALVRPDHRYLDDTHALFFLPAWWTRRSSPSDVIPRPAHLLFVEGAATTPRTGATLPPTIPAELFQGSAVTARFSDPVLLRDRDATVIEIRRKIKQAEIFHYNGHTLTSMDQTGLLLRSPDHLFTAADLHGISIRKCRLAVLAACSSARGGNHLEDTANLIHAFLAAGAHNVVATLWDVDARTSKTMMLRMYDLLAQSIPLSEALRQSRLDIRSSAATHHPYFWSSVQVFRQ
jgi:CHAT domain-containing protein/tetratricopeptide (TPR) repeat protein